MIQLIIQNLRNLIQKDLVMRIRLRDIRWLTSRSVIFLCYSIILSINLFFHFTGDGPRNCIGNRFGLMQTKIALIQLLTNFKFSKTEKTPEKLIFNPRSPILQPLVDVVLILEKLK